MLKNQNRTSRGAPPEAGDWARLSAVLDRVGDALFVIDRHWRIVIFNRAAEVCLGARREHVLGRELWELFPQGRGTEFELRCRIAMDERRETSFETPSALRTDRMVELRMLPMPADGVAVFPIDVAERRAAEAELRAERDRTAEILESISDAFYAVDDDLRFTYVNRVAERWWGLRREDLIGKPFFEVFPQAVGSSTHQAQLDALRDRQVQRLEAVSAVLGRWVEVSIFPGRTGLSVYFRDITERKMAQERQRLLVNELNHRVKNTLTVVQAIARQTLTGARSLAEARIGFTDRLLALAAAHDVLTRQNWAGADLAEVIERSAQAQVDRPERLEIAGPAVILPPKLALSLALALHELLTNALKYGALSVPAGRIALSWRIEEGAAGRRLHLTWRETGGPPVTAPVHRGFGSRLIERALAADVSGRVELRFEPGGVVCVVDADLGDSGAQELTI